MPTALTCPCGKTLRVRDEDAGKRGKCPACGGVVRVGAASELPESPGLIRLEGPNPVKVKPVPAACDVSDGPRRRRTVPAGVAALLGVGCVALGAFALIRDDAARDALRSRDEAIAAADAVEPVKNDDETRELKRRLYRLQETITDAGIQDGPVLGLRLQAAILAYNDTVKRGTPGDVYSVKGCVPIDTGKSGSSKFVVSIHKAGSEYVTRVVTDDEVDPELYSLWLYRWMAYTREEFLGYAAWAACGYKGEGSPFSAPAAISVVSFKDESPGNTRAVLRNTNTGRTYDLVVKAYDQFKLTPHPADGGEASGAS
jgi:hypothetical protein